MSILSWFTQASSENGECGIVLLGDAAHSFSPDIGKGINVGLMDVVQFKEIYSKFNDYKPTNFNGNMGSMLNEYNHITGHLR